MAEAYMSDFTRSPIRALASRNAGVGQDMAALIERV
jgi:hypothetical protein